MNPKDTIPQTDSIQALAAFWDTHDLTDFEHALDEVTDPVFMSKTVQQEELVQIRLPLTDVEVVKQIAQDRGIDYTDLIQEWVLEKVRVA